MEVCQKGYSYAKSNRFFCRPLPFPQLNNKNPLSWPKTFCSHPLNQSAANAAAAARLIGQIAAILIMKADQM